MSPGINFRLWYFHPMLLTHVIIFIVVALLGVRAQDVLSLSHEIKARIEPPEDVLPRRRPVITSTSSRQRVSKGSMIMFPCQVENLGSNVVLWKRGLTHALFSGSVRVDPDVSISVISNNSLKITSVMPEHAGTYICHVSSSPPMELTHVLEVLVQPEVKSIPSDGQMVVKKDDSVTLVCHAEGYPAPVITWSTKEGSLPRGIPEKQGNILTIPSVDTYHSGEYHCTAENEVGNVTARFKVKVLYIPEIRVKPSWIHGGLGSAVEFTCSVSAEPAASIQWTHSDGSALNQDDHISIQSEGSSSVKVKIKRITMEHFGTYICSANNSLGTSQEAVAVSGLAEPANFRGNSTGEDETSFLLVWTVKSFSPVIEYMLRIRRKEDGAESQQNPWTEVVIPVAVQQSVLHSHSYNVTGLEPATAYEAIIVARNDFGYNHPSDAFVFYTYGTGQLQDVLEEQPFGATTLLHPTTSHHEEEEEAKDSESNPEMEVKPNTAVKHEAVECLILTIVVFLALSVSREM